MQITQYRAKIGGPLGFLYNILGASSAAIKYAFTFGTQEAHTMEVVVVSSKYGHLEVLLDGKPLSRHVTTIHDFSLGDNKYTFTIPGSEHHIIDVIVNKTQAIAFDHGRSLLCSIAIDGKNILDKNKVIS